MLDAPDFQRTVVLNSTPSDTVPGPDSPDWQETIQVVPSADLDAPDWQVVAVGPGGTPIGPSGPGVPATFGTPVYGGDYADIASVAIPIAGVVSGQPLVLLVSSINDGVHAPDVTDIADTFATPYTWYRT